MAAWAMSSSSSDQYNPMNDYDQRSFSAGSGSHRAGSSTTDQVIATISPTSQHQRKKAGSLSDHEHAQLSSVTAAAAETSDLMDDERHGRYYHPPSSAGAEADDEEEEEYTNFNDVLSHHSSDSVKRHHSLLGGGVGDFDTTFLGDAATSKGRRRRGDKNGRGRRCCGCLPLSPGVQKRVFLTTCLILVIGIPTITLLVLRAQPSPTTKFRTALISSGVFVLLTLPISLYEILLHWTHYYMPDVQKFVVRILFMVPLYSVQAWCSLRFHGKSVAIDTVRGLYEAFVISSFVYYLIALLGGEEHMARVLRRKDESYGRHPCVLEYIPGIRPWSMGADFLLQCKHGALQYVVLKTLATIAVVVLYCTGNLSISPWYRSPNFYITVVMNFSVSWALYCLVKLYYATRDDLKDWNPAGKFLCVKGVVFFTFWQGVVIEVLTHYGVIDLMLRTTGTNGAFGKDYVSGCLQDYLVCMEMLVFAVAHRYTFTYREYVTDNLRGGLGGRPLWDDEDPRDVPLLQDGEDDEGDGGGGKVGVPGASTVGDDKGSGVRKTSHHRKGNAGNKEVRQGNEEEETGEGEYDGYHVPVIRQLYAPLSLPYALWSSAVPDETLSDIGRLGLRGSDDVQRSMERKDDMSLLAENAEAI